MILREIAGDRVAVHTLLPPGASPHTFSARPRDLRWIAEADWVLRVGGAFDGWAVTLLAAAPPVAKRTELLGLAGLEPLPLEHRHGPVAEAARGGDLDPHCWLDPLRVRDVVVPALRAELQRIDPAHTEIYADRARSFRARLDDLDEELRALFAAETAPLVSLHPAWHYFADRYGLREIGVIERQPGEAPSPRALIDLVRRARAARVRQLLIEPQLPSSAAQALADELDASLVRVDPLGDPRVPERAHYSALLRYNARAIAGRGEGASQ